MHSVCVAIELHITVNYIKIWNFAHQCFNGKSMMKLTVSLHNFVKAPKNRSRPCLKVAENMLFALTELELRIRVEVPLKDRKGESFICCVAHKHILLKIHHISFSQRWPDLSTSVCACACV